MPNDYQIKQEWDPSHIPEPNPYSMCLSNFGATRNNM